MCHILITAPTFVLSNSCSLRRLRSVELCHCEPFKHRCRGMDGVSLCHCYAYFKVACIIWFIHISYDNFFLYAVLIYRRKTNIQTYLNMYLIYSVLCFLNCIHLSSGPFTVGVRILIRIQSDDLLIYSIRQYFSLLYGRLLTAGSIHIKTIINMNDLSELYCADLQFFKYMYLLHYAPLLPVNLHSSVCIIRR